MALFGLPVERFLTTRSRLERKVLVELTHAAWEMNDLLQRNLAVHVINAYAKATR